MNKVGTIVVHQGVEYVVVARLSNGVEVLRLKSAFRGAHG